MIGKHYIDEALRIRETYLKTIDEVLDKEKIINKYKVKVSNKMNILKDYVDNLEDDTITENIKKDLIKDTLNIEIELKNISKEIVPLLDIIEKLKKESKNLYNKIKEKYPELSEQDIQKEIFLNLKK